MSEMSLSMDSIIFPSLASYIVYNSETSVISQTLLSIYWVSTCTVLMVDFFCLGVVVSLPMDSIISSVASYIVYKYEIPVVTQTPLCMYLESSSTPFVVGFFRAGVGMSLS